MRISSRGTSAPRVTFRMLERDDRYCESDLSPELAERGIFYVDDMEATFYVSHACGPVQDLVVGSSGLNTQKLASDDFMARLRDASTSSIHIVIGDLYHQRNFMPRLAYLTEQFLVHPRSPVNALFDPGLKRTAINYSTGLQNFIAAQLSEESNDIIEAFYPRAINLSGYLESAGASRKYSGIGRRLYHDTIDRYPDKRPHEVFRSAAYMRLRAPLETYTQDTRGSHARFYQFREVELNGCSLIDCAENDAVAEEIARVEHIFYHGRDDHFACGRTTKDFSDKIGGQFKWIEKAGHDPLEDQPDLIDELIEIVKRPADYETTARSRIQSVPSFVPVSSSGFSLGHSASLALQAGTSAFNTAASFAKSFLAGGVRNAEVRGQPESDALNRRHAL